MNDDARGAISLYICMHADDVYTNVHVMISENLVRGY